MQTKVKVKKKKKRTKPIDVASESTTSKNPNQSADPKQNSNPTNTRHDDTECTIQLLDDTLSIIQYGTKKIFLIGTHHEHLTSAQVTKLYNYIISIYDLSNLFEFSINFDLFQFFATIQPIIDSLICFPVSKSAK